MNTFVHTCIHAHTSARVTHSRGAVGAGNRVIRSQRRAVLTWQTERHGKGVSVYASERSQVCKKVRASVFMCCTFRSDVLFSLAFVTWLHVHIHICSVCMMCEVWSIFVTGGLTSSVECVCVCVCHEKERTRHCLIETLQSGKSLFRNTRRKKIFFLRTIRGAAIAEEDCFLIIIPIACIKSEPH
jgi:hypothetical protein